MTKISRPSTRSGVGLSIKIDQGTIKLKDAIDLFDHASDKVIRKKLAEQNENKKAL